MPSISQGRPNQKITSPNTCFSGALKHTGINQFYKNLMQDLRLPLPLPIKNHTYYVDGQTFKNNCKALSDAIYALPHRANLHNELKEYDHITCDIYKRTPSLNETIQDGLSIIQTSISLRNRLESWIAEGEANEQRSEAVNRIVNAVKNNETELNLSNLGLTTVPPDIGLFLPELNVLDLSHNQLTQVNETMIDQLTHLNDIQLIGNQLISLPDNIKKHYENDTNKIINYYKTWVLSGTPNERRTEAVDRIVNAVKNNETTLNLSGLQLTAIPPDIGLFLPELKKLDLSYNINCDVDFSYNRRKNLPANIFQSLKNLTDLNLMGFDLVTTPDCNIFQSLTKLERLNLGFNRLKNLPANLFQSLTNLRILDLSHNKIERLDATIFQSLQNLEGLSIRENRLTNLDATIFQSLINLKCLLINDNPLTTIPPTVFESLTNLNELELNNNRLVRFELSADARTALQNARVNLQSNQLNAHTVQSLIEAQNAPGYVGPQYWLSIHDPNAISTVAITCQDLPRLVALWRNINNHEPLSTLNAMAIFLARLWRGCTGENDDESSQNIHPQWASLAHRSALNNMAIFLARLWNECPRDANHEIPTSTRTMVQRILSAFEAIMNDNEKTIEQKLETPLIGACMAAAETGVGTCIDKIGVGLILMDRQAALFLTNNHQEKEAITRDLRRIQAIRNTVEQFNSNQLYYDTPLKKIVNVATGLGSINVNQLPEAYQHSNYTDYATCAYENGEDVLPETFWRALQWDAINEIRQNNNLTPYTQIRIGDEVEDILGLINKGIDDKYLTTFLAIPMRYGGCRAIVKGSNQESAVMTYLKSLPEN